MQAALCKDWLFIHVSTGLLIHQLIGANHEAELIHVCMSLDFFSAVE